MENSLKKIIGDYLESSATFSGDFVDHLIKRGLSPYNAHIVADRCWNGVSPDDPDVNNPEFREHLDTIKFREACLEILGKDAHPSSTSTQTSDNIPA